MFFLSFFSNQFDISEFQKVNTIIKILSNFYVFYGFFHTERVKRMNNRIYFESQFRSQLNLKTFSLDFFSKGKLSSEFFGRGH